MSTEAHATSRAKLLAQLMYSHDSCVLVQEGDLAAIAPLEVAIAQLSALRALPSTSVQARPLPRGGVGELDLARVALPRRHDGGRLYRRVVEEIPASQKDTPQ